MVSTSEPASAACSTCSGCRTAAVMIWVWKAVVAVDGLDLPHQLHAVVADGIQAADKRADVGRAHLGRQQRLQRREGHRHIGLVALRRPGSSPP